MDSATKSKSGKKWIIATAVLSLLALIFFIIMLVFIVKYQNLSNGIDDGTAKGKMISDMKESEPLMAKQFVKSDQMYSDFTKEEYDAIIAFMKNSTLGVVSSAEANLSSNYIFSIDPILPPKSEVLNFLKTDDASAPMIKAKVTLFMGASNPKSIKEVIVYPVSNPSTTEEFVNPGNKVPTWQSRPVCNRVEAGILDRYLLQTLKPLTPMLTAHFNMWYDDSCGDGTCLFYVPVPRVVPGRTDRTLFIIFHYSPDQVDYYLWAIPLTLVLYTPDNGDVYQVLTVVYDNIEYDNVQELVDAYNAGNVTDVSPEIQKDYVNSYGSPQRRGKDVNPGKLSPPIQVSNSRRFSVDGRHVSWLGWEFDFVFRTISAAQLYNLQFNGESIAYQLGLQDIFVIYTGSSNHNTAFRNYMDVGWSIGSRTSSLSKGYDCPDSAEYITGTVYEVGLDRPTVLQNCACVFEYRNHIPLRRHYSADFFDYTTFRFNMNMADVVLVFRQILTVWNYDYIFDVEIHQSGVIKTSLTPTGYVQVTAHSESDGVRYGYDILPNPGMVALLHSHLFDFKVDLDIVDENTNRFMTVDIESETKPHPYNPAVNMSYMVMKESLKSSEQEAIIHYDFAKPKQFIVYNHAEMNPRNKQPRGYRIQSESWVNPILPSADVLFTAASWVNHQVSVTKRKDVEESTLSFFSQGDPYNPVISLSDFQADNESIVDIDLVCWVSIGVNHIPTAEDVPVTTTASKTMSFYLIPHNYYIEDPSIASRDAELSFPDS